jgi:hydrogenase maturation protease
VSLADLMDMARLTDRLPTRRALIGIEPALVDWGDGLTPEVAAAVPLAMAEVRRLLSRWDGTPFEAAPWHSVGDKAPTK